jgi:hypothetical protein
MLKKQTVSRLTKQPYWHAFAEAMLNGSNQADALRLARPQLVATWDRASIVAEASRMADDPRVVAHIEKEQAKRTEARRKREAKLMDNLERREICRDVATAEESNGLTKLAAVKTDAQLAGEWLERQEVSQTVNLQALLAELPQSGLPVAHEVAPALPPSAPATPQDHNAVQSLPNSSACDWELLDE